MKSHGTGEGPWKFSRIGSEVIIENQTLVFHPENIQIGNNVYVGHQTILKGYYKNRMVIEDGVWIGQQCFFHSAGGIHIEPNVGVGPGVKILTSAHTYKDPNMPIMHQPVEIKAVAIGEGSDIGVGAVILPGVTLGKGVQVGAGAVVSRSFEAGAVIAGVPAKRIDSRF
jgi:acetyltransferase-like isoleucine patch superfamily enzyme